MGKRTIECGSIVISPIDLPNTITEEVDGVLIGKSTLSVEELFPWRPDDSVSTLINDLNTVSSKTQREREFLTYHLNNNTASEYGSVRHARPVSAYFTLDPEAQALILEWGTIDSKGNAKLHTHLNKAIDFRSRKAKGMTLSSGHIARMSSGIHLALLDGLAPSTFINRQTSMGQMVNALYAHNFVPLDSGGHVQLPAF